MKNEILAVTLKELWGAGKDPVIKREKRHIIIEWPDGRGGTVQVTVSKSPSDWRSARNKRAEVRRLLRGDPR